MIKPKKVPVSSPVIQNCTFDARTIWDADAIKVMENVSKSLLNLTELFKSQNIKMEAMLVVGNTEKEN